MTLTAGPYVTTGYIYVETQIPPRFVFKLSPRRAFFGEKTRAEAPRHKPQPLRRDRVHVPASPHRQHRHMRQRTPAVVHESWT